MPIATRRQARARSRNQHNDTPTADVSVGEMPSQVAEDAALIDQEMDEDEHGVEEDEEVVGKQPLFTQLDFICSLLPADGELEPFPPPGLKEISSLASWTVSTAKPGNGVAALRSPDTSLFWQSDGPQPHLLSIHFFKLVSIVHMRIYLDFEADESYTPTKIQFLAGMGVHDIQEFAEMSFEQPTGWIDVDFSNVGPIETTEDEDADPSKEIDWSKRPVLRAFLVQIKILENHQNGKDTHLRAVQLFARDDMLEFRNADRGTQKMRADLPLRNQTKSNTSRTEPNNIKLASWMLEPELR